MAYRSATFDPGRCFVVLVCGHKFENMTCKIENAQVIETHGQDFRYTNWF